MEVSEHVPWQPVIETAFRVTMMLNAVALQATSSTMGFEHNLVLVIGMRPITLRKGICPSRAGNAYTDCRFHKETYQSPYTVTFKVPSWVSLKQWLVS